MSLAFVACIAFASLPLPQDPSAGDQAPPAVKGQGQSQAVIREPPPIEDRSTPLPPPRPAEARALTEILVLGPLESPRRSPIVVDPWRARLVRGTAEAPAEGAAVETGSGSVAWKPLKAADGQFEDPALRNGWGYARIVHPQEEVQLLEVRGPTDLVVDGIPRGGDAYETGLIRVPFVARPGGTDVYLRAQRGRLSASVQNPPAPIYIEDRDVTLPDLVRGRMEQFPGSVVIVNATDKQQLEVLVTCTAEFFSGTERAAQQYLSTLRVPTLFPLEVRKLTVPLPLFFEFDSTVDIDEFTLIVSLHQVDEPNNQQISLSQVRFPIRVRRPDQTYRTTYQSEVDESAQYYTVLQASAAKEGEERRGLVLSLHGAGVESQAQAECYAPKDWCHIVAPTNRRPFGFDWEDWGRLDALDVLADASERLGTDPSRVHVTGHSMGGHGAWLLGAMNPNTFAAVAPSAGWCDFWSYGNAWQPSAGNALEELLARAANTSRTPLVLPNLAQRGVYIVHGDADDNVPVSEARDMRKRLTDLGFEPAYEERAGAGHWTGNDAVDWPALFEYLEPRRLPDDQVLRVRFATVNPATSARLHWIEVQAQHRSLEPTTLDAELDPAARRFKIETANLARMRLDLSLLSSGSAPLAYGLPFEIAIDGQVLKLQWPPTNALLLFQAKPDGPWYDAQGVPAAHKSPLRAGPFKDALRNRMTFVYATGGTPEENEWSVRRALFDIEQWRSRGNGRADLWSDELFLTTQPHWRGQRNIVVYGHADMNKAWSLLAQPCPIDARRGKVRIGTRTIERDDLALLFTFPRSESDIAAAAVVCGTGPVGQRLTEALPYFSSGVAYPDWSVFAPEMLEQGSAGVIGAGFFGYDWSLARGQHAWQDQP
jgi:pimeloyl-ACP methyl ester carboxylesterase